MKNSDIIRSIRLLPSLNLKIRNVIINEANKRYSLYKIRKADVFHPTFYDDYFLEKDMLGRKSLVLTVHDMTAEKYIPNDETIKQKHRLIKRADKVIAISNNTKNDILHYVPVNPDKIHVVYHGISCVNPALTGERLFDRPYVLYVGARYSYKNFRLLVNSFAKIASRFKDLILVCTGSPFNVNELAYFESLKIIDRVYSRFVSEPELCNLYKYATCFVYPSLYEGFGLPILEAFTLNCPVLAANTSCFPEVGGDAIYYFDPLSEDSLIDAMIHILEDSQLREFFISKAKIRVRNFSWDKTAKEMACIYKELL